MLKNIFQISSKFQQKKSLNLLKNTQQQQTCLKFYFGSSQASSSQQTKSNNFTQNNHNINNQSSIPNEFLSNKHLKQNLHNNQEDPECSNCEASNFKKNRFICGSCKTLLPPERKLLKLDFFQLFNLQKTFDIDKKFLDQQYKELMQNFHPDRFFYLNNKALIKDCEEYSSYVNDAYSNLKSDYYRAEYLLVLNGMKLENLEGYIIDDLDFLDDILFLREEIQSCKDRDRILEIEESVNKDRAYIVEQLKKDFSHQDFDAALENLKVLKYHDSTLQQIAEKLNFL